ncbi:MAG TPA: YfhO family protein, partial [Bryobacteraceae bacterium]
NESASTIAAVGVALAGVLYWLRGAPVAVLALFFVEASTFPPTIQPVYQPGSFLSQIAEQSDIAQFLKSQPGWFRFAADQDAVPYNLGDLYSIEEFSGYMASLPERVHRMVGHQETPRMFGVKYWVARAPSSPDQVEVFRSRSGVKVYQNPGIGEPLWTVHKFSCEGQDQLRVVSRVSNAMSIDADMACAGLMVAGDPWYPGWRAWVDGRRVPVREYDGVLRAVPVDAGHHRVEFRYRPGSVYWGTGLTLLGLLLTGVFQVIDRGTKDSSPRSR